MKKLELGIVPIKDIQFASKSEVKGDTLYVNKEDIIDLLKEDENIENIELFIAKPGDSIRIMPVKDVIEPRVKVSGNGAMFPGMVSKVDVVGEGRTNVLRGMAVVTTGKIVAFQEGIIDMTGEGAKYTPFSQLNNLVLKVDTKEDIDKHKREASVRMAGLKTADFVGKLAKDIEAKEVETFETLNVKEGAEKYPNLPRVAYVYMLQSQGLMHDTYVYGVDAKQTLSTIIYPTEVMDGAIVSGNCVSACDKNTTYHHLNNPVIRALFAEHGKNINFVGVVITNENVYLADKMRSSDWASKLCDFLGVDGAIVSEEGFGNPDTDLIMNCKKITAKGIKTVLVTDEYAGQDGKSQSLADADASADAVVTGGNANMVINIGPLDTVIGYPEVADVIAGGTAGSLRPDGSIEAELQVITGATNEIGFNKFSAR